jgi:hypothetical protein
MQGIQMSEGAACFFAVIPIYLIILLLEFFAEPKLRRKSSPNFINGKLTE